MVFLEVRFANRRRRRRRRKGGRNGTDRDGGGGWFGPLSTLALRDSLLFLFTRRSSNSQFLKDGMAWGREGHRMLRGVPSTIQMGRVFLGCTHIGRLNTEYRISLGCPCAPESFKWIHGRNVNVADRGMSVVPITLPGRVWGRRIRLEWGTRRFIIFF